MPSNTKHLGFRPVVLQLGLSHAGVALFKFNVGEGPVDADRELMQNPATARHATPTVGRFPILSRLQLAGGLTAWRGGLEASTLLRKCKQADPRREEGA
jgi:hypothetical protein